MTTLAHISNKQKIAVMISVMLAMFLSALDQTIVATAMPRIVEELNGLEHLSWVFTAYMLASTVVVPIYGKLSDLYGRKNFVLGAIGIFLVGSILSGLSQSMTQLIAFRAIQGIGGGAIFANAFATIGDLFPPAQRGKWQGLFGAVFGLSSVIGPSLGGFLTDNVSWRWNFFINIPIGLAAFFAILFLMPKIVPHAKDKSIDFGGAFFLAVGLITLLLGFVWGGNQYAWNSPEIITLFASTLVSFGIFGFIEQRVKQPILPLSLFKNPIFSVSMVIIFLTGIGMFGSILYVPLFAQLVLGTSATDSGGLLTPLMLGMVASSIVTGQVVSRTGKYKIFAVVGLGIAATAMYFLSRMSVDTTQMDLIVRMVATGIGLGVSFPIFNLAVQNAFEHSQLGVVTAATQLFRSIGGTVGTAILGGILNSGLSKRLGELTSDPFAQSMAKQNPQFDLTKLDANSLQGLLTGQGRVAIEHQLATLPPAVQPQAMAAFQGFITKVKGIFATSVSEVFLLSAVVMGLGFVIALFLKEIPLRKGHEINTPEKAGKELAEEEAILPAKSEPTN
jgi:EmrB/QacA subfamily drug resistance transporter